MESGTTGIGRIDSYEDMFKEITRKLYGDDPDHRTSSVQNEFETSVSYKNDEDTGNGTDSDDGNWTCEEEPLKGTDGSRIAAYHAGKTTWRCYECGNCLNGGPRDMAEHFMELHSSRIFDDTRNRHHSGRKDYLQSDVKLEDILTYLERVRDRAERQAPPSRRTQETQTVPAALLPATTPFMLQELPSTPPQHLHSSPPTMTTSTTSNSSNKRYTCPYCPYGTDRRDLYTRHENIHREEKPFHCYVCYKPFNRADHVKKHFLRMHREHTYELSKIRRTPSTNGTKTVHENTNGNYTTNYNNNKSYQLQTTQATAPALYQAASMTTVGVIQDSHCNRRVQNTGCNSKSHVKGSKGAQERRYTCCYCSWSGVDNWCLKRHLNTHLKPFACALCEYKAARAERLATHVLKVHNKRQCSRCSFLGEDAAQLQIHQLHVHRINTGNSSGGSAPPVPAQSPGMGSPGDPSATPAPAPTINRHDSVLPAGGGRPPPGPPVFPAPAVAVVPPPTTILGETFSNGRNRRKQNQPRKVLTDAELEEEEEEKRKREIDDKKNKNDKYLRCLRCPVGASARAQTPYHTKASLMLHILWRHTSQRKNNSVKRLEKR